MTTDIKDLMIYGERINIEYKEAAGVFPKSLWVTHNVTDKDITGKELAAKCQIKRRWGAYHIKKLKQLGSYKCTRIDTDYSILF